MKSKKLLLLVLALALTVCMVMTAVACGDTTRGTNNVDNTANGTVATNIATLDDVKDVLNIIDDKLQSQAADTAEINAMLSAVKTKLDASETDANLLAYYNELCAKLQELNGILNPEVELFEYSDECYEKIKYIDNAIPDRDCINGKDFKIAQKWIEWTALQAGYTKDDISYQDVTFSRYTTLEKATDFQKAITANKYVKSDKFYKRSGRDYVECEETEATYVKFDITSPNIIITKQGKSEKQIIVGAHYDGTGTGDNGSGVALALTTAEKIKNVDTQYTIVFVFFTGEEYGTYGATQYAEAMTDAEVEKTLYYINLDSIVCGDYAYLYGGLQVKDKTVNDDGTETITYTISQTEAYENALAVAAELGLEFRANPWSEDNLPPNGKLQYVTPTTGDWSDHEGFKYRGIQYVYFEATNWEIPDYTGYGETYLVGMIMNTSKDYLEYIEKYFPGRIQEHFKKFSALLYALVTQENVDLSANA